MLSKFFSRSISLAGFALCAAAAPLSAGPQTPDEFAPAAIDPLLDGFRQPSQDAKPRVWWHWMGGNVTMEGAELDLEWMKRIGIGGVHAFSGAISDPKVIDPPVRFMSPEWRRIFARALQITRDANMELTIAGSPGWSQTGGPWVEPLDGMKKYVWSETRIVGGKRFAGILAEPPATTGAFMGAPAAKRADTAPPPHIYRDSFVVAFPTPGPESRNAPIVYDASVPNIDLSPIARPDLSGSVTLPVMADTGNCWVAARFARPTKVWAVTLGVVQPVGAGVEIQASNDGRTFRTILRTEARGTATIDVPAPQRTYAFAPVLATHIRAVLTVPPPPAPLGGMPAAWLPKPLSAITLSKLIVETGPRVDRFEAKAGFEATIDATAPTPAPIGAEAAIAKTAVVDLTGRMTADGRLDWTPPKGNWTVLRFGWSLTGHMNGPAEPGATGLEVDKLDPAAVRRYLDNYLKLFADAAGGRLGGDGVQNLLLDSWEAGVQNWTPSLLAEFRSRRGYDPLPYLPVLTGRVVADSDASERFLWDFRQTLKDLVAANHHGLIAKELHGRGMGLYSEANGDNPRVIADGMALKARADIPTAEYWYRPFAAGPGQLSLKADMAEAASAAHIYGKRFAAAESLTVAAFTDPWAFSPAMLKPVTDEIFAHGINRILLHDSHMQPLRDKKPGLALSVFGQYFNRNDTWAEDAKPWVDYLARTSQMLQQGRYVADVAYYFGEEHNLTELFRDRSNTDVPAGYRFDYVNPEALLTLLQVRDGKIETPSGMSYRVLYIPAQVARYRLETLRKIRDLVSAGAVIVGAKPTGGLGLASSDDAIRAIADEVWGKNQDPAVGHRFGRGRVYATSELARALDAEGIAPDVIFGNTAADAQPLMLHRRTGEAEIYFLSNQRASALSFAASFRVAGKAPELWRAESGSVERLAYRLTGDRVEVPLSLAPHEAIFVVFRRPAEAQQWAAPEVRSEELATLEGPWMVSFETGRGAPQQAKFEELRSWPDSADPGIRYFSGSATYSRTVDVPAAWLSANRRVELDLGEVRELAAVRVNGKPVATAWHAPYQVDITKALRRGRNRVEIRVVNLWPNRLIGDKQPGARPVAYAPQSPYSANSPLLPSGLLGPVRIVGTNSVRELSSN